MKTRRVLVAVAASALLALGGTTALAASGDRGGGPGQDPAAKCERAQSLLEKLQSRAAKIADRIAQIQARIDGGQLTDEQLAKAQERLAKLQDHQTKLQGRIDELSGKIAERCSGGGDGSTTSGTTA